MWATLFAAKRYIEVHNKYKTIQWQYIYEKEKTACDEPSIIWAYRYNDLGLVLSGYCWLQSCPWVYFHRPIPTQPNSTCGSTKLPKPRTTLADYNNQLFLRLFWEAASKMSITDGVEWLTDLLLKGCWHKTPKFRQTVVDTVSPAFFYHLSMQFKSSKLMFSHKWGRVGHGSIFANQVQSDLLHKYLVLSRTIMCHWLF